MDLHFNYVGLLSDTFNKHRLVVIPEQQFEANGRLSYDLQIFSSETMWRTTKVARTACGLEGLFNALEWFRQTKVLNIGGGLLGWVDLRRGILMCDVVDKEQEMRLIRFPPLMATNRVNFAVDSDGCGPSLRWVRDVTCRNGCINLVEMEMQMPDFDSRNAQLPWTASMFKRMIWSEKWDECCTINSNDLSPSYSCFPCLFPEIFGTARRTS